jgi:hypothetical protein
MRRVLLVLDEATNAELCTEHEVHALAELQKDSYGLDIHILVQSPNSFPSSRITDGVLTNSIRHEYFYLANAGGIQKAAEDLGDSDWATVIRGLEVGERVVKDRNGVRSEKVPQLDNPWVFPELAELKTRRAIEEIYQRPEYGRNEECPPPSTGVNATPQSPDGQPGTHARPDITSSSSPARRLRTGGSRRSEKADS